MLDTMLELSCVSINSDTQQLHITGLCENRETIDITIELANVTKLVMGTESNVTHIELHWPVRRCIPL